MLGATSFLLHSYIWRVDNSFHQIQGGENLSSECNFIVNSSQILLAGLKAFNVEIQGLFCIKK